jgi:hypothetical protein
LRLIDLNPRWFVDADIVIGGVNRHFDNRHGMGITFDCPCCGGQTRLGVWIANPVDGGPPTDDADVSHRWQRTGETFETLTLQPSIDASGAGHWHGYITAGEIR